MAAVCSRKQMHADQFAARHGHIAAYASLEAMLADSEVEAVYIASPNNLHAQTAISVLGSGKPVLVEKPLATSVADASRIADQARQTGLFAMEAMWTRFLPAVAHARKLVASGQIGRIRRIRADLAHLAPQDPDSRLFSARLGGGALLDLGVYPLSLAQLFLGKMELVQANWRRAATGVDISADMTLVRGDCEARLSCALDREGANLFAVEGDEGTLILQPPFSGTQMIIEARGGAATLLSRADGMSTSARALRKLARSVPLPGITRHFNPFEGYGLQFEIEAASQMIRAGQQVHPAAPLSDSIDVLRIIEAVRDRLPDTS